jgi:hypothetical protein
VDAQQIVRVPQPPGLSSNAGNLEEVVDWGSPSFGSFSWRIKKGNQPLGYPRQMRIERLLDQVKEGEVVGRFVFDHCEYQM